MYCNYGNKLLYMWRGVTMKKIAQSNIDQIINLYQAGTPTNQIAERCGIFPESVNRILKNHGIEKNRCVKTSPEQIKVIIERYSDGESSEKIAKDLGINGSTVCRILKRNKISIRPATENKLKYPNHTFDYFSKIDAPQKSYFLGLMFSDGNVSKNRKYIKIEILNKDRKVLCLFSHQVFGFEKITNRIKPDTGHEICRFGVNSQRMKDDLIKLGCMPNKTFKITFPNFPYMSHFLRGYLDGDGCISVAKNRCRVIFTCNVNFGNGLQQFLLNSLDIKSSVSKYTRSEVVDITISNINDCVKFLNYIYNDCQNFYMDRKYEKYQEVLKFKLYKEMKNDK